MTAIVIGSEGQMVPNGGIKMHAIVTTAAAATGHTYDATGLVSTIIATYLCDSTGAVKVATWSSLTVTLGTISTGVHTLIIIGK
jgi:hypothetical protein